MMVAIRKAISNPTNYRKKYCIHRDYNYCRLYNFTYFYLYLNKKTATGIETHGDYRFQKSNFVSLNKLECR